MRGDTATIFLAALLFIFKASERDLWMFSLRAYVFLYSHHVFLHTDQRKLPFTISRLLE